MRRKKGTKLVAAILVIIMLFGLVGAGIMPLADEKNSTDGIAVDSGEVTISEMTAKLVAVKNEQSEPDPAEENPGEENPGEENPGEENPGEAAPGEAEGEDAEITEIALTYKDNKLLVENKDVETLKAWLDEGSEYSVYLQVTAKAKDHYDYSNVNKDNPNGQLVDGKDDNKLIALENGELKYGTLKIEFAALPTATITITGDLVARDGCSVKGYKENAEGKVVITATKDTVIELVPGFEFKKDEIYINGVKFDGKMADAIASIGSGEEGNEQITAVVEKTDGDGPELTTELEIDYFYGTDMPQKCLLAVTATDAVSKDDVTIKVTKGEGKNEKTLSPNKEGKYEFGLFERVIVIATDAAGNMSKKTVSRVLSVDSTVYDYDKKPAECVISGTVNSAEFDSRYNYFVALYKNGERIDRIACADLENDSYKFTVYDNDKNDNTYQIQLRSLSKKAASDKDGWRVQFAAVEVKFDHEAPTISADNLGKFINSLTIGVGEDAGQIVVKDEKGGSGVANVFCRISYEGDVTKKDNDGNEVTERGPVYVAFAQNDDDKESQLAGEYVDIHTGEYDYDNPNDQNILRLDFTNKDKYGDLNGKDLTIEVYAVDKAGNKSETKTYTATVDTTPPEIDNVAFECAKDKNGNAICTNSGDYHKAARTATITVSDKNLEKGTVTIVKNEDTENPITFEAKIGSDGKLSGILAKDKDGNYFPASVYGISVDGNKITFEDDGVYQIKEIVASDRAGNETPKTEGLGGEFEIDTTAPTIDDVTFGCKECLNKAEEHTYHSEARTATITVSDKNLSGGTVTIVKNGDEKNKIEVPFSIENGKLNLPNLERDDIAVIARTEGGNVVDEKTGVRTIKFDITFSGDGEYEITKIEANDLAGNETPKDKGLGGEFVIDTTNPIVSVSYAESKGAENGKYYNVIRTATISVTEANFEKEIHVVKNFDGDECKKPGVYVVINLGEGDAENVIKNPIFNVEKSIENAKWTDEGEEHTITVTYDANKAYTFDIKVVDQALRSNQLATDISTDKDFVIDKDIVAPVISGVSEGAAYPDECVPTITFTDANYHSGEVRIYQTRDGQINRDVTSKFGTGINTNGANGTGGVSVINTIAKVPENDGIYTIVATMRDMAGNTSESRVTFSVNRFGSVYKLGDEVANLRDSYVRSVKNDLVLTEINPDMLIAGSAKVSITRNGKPIDVIFDVAPNPDKNAAAIGSSGWYEYIYTISAKNFEKDGAYVITVSSTDEAGNNSSTTSYEECSMEFKVDSTKPEFTSLVGLEKAIINAESAPVTFGVHDAIGISNITLYCDGKVIASFESKDITDVNNFEGKFVVPEGSNQVVRIVVVDLAGNVTDTEKLIAADELPEFMENIQDITVSTNFFVRWFANKLVFFGSIIGVIAVGAAAWWFLFGKKRSKSETNS